jgi:hypothetical protein
MMCVIKFNGDNNFTLSLDVLIWYTKVWVDQKTNNLVLNWHFNWSNVLCKIDQIVYIWKLKNNHKTVLRIRMNGDILIF